MSEKLPGLKWPARRRKRGTKDDWRKNWPPAELLLPSLEELLRLSRVAEPVDKKTEHPPTVPSLETLEALSHASVR